MIVVDDSGLLQPQEGDRWKLVSVPQRFPNLGAKRQFGNDLLAHCDAILTWDDDDVFWPHAISTVAAVLETAPWAQNRLCYHHRGDSLAVISMFGTRDTDWGYGAAWAFRADALRHVGGYESLQGVEDVPMARKMYAAFGVSANSTPSTPWHLYNDQGPHHAQYEGPSYWRIRGELPAEEHPELVIGWNGPNIYELPVLPGVHPRPW